MKRTHARFTSIIILLLLTSIAVGSTVQKEKNDAEKLVTAARFLEQKPFDKEAKKARSWAMQWLIVTDKVNVKVCSLLVSGIDEKYKYGSELIGQYTIGMAAYKLANPDKAPDEDAAQQAGIESALTSYESMLTEQPKARNTFMDELLAKRGQGSLAAYVKENNCKDLK